MVHFSQWHKSSYSSGKGEDCVEMASWYKSSYSQPEGPNCLEFSPFPHAGAAVRDSKRPNTLHLAFSSGEWAAFLSGLKGGEFGR